MLLVAPRKPGLFILFLTLVTRLGFAILHVVMPLLKALRMLLSWHKLGWVHRGL